MKQLSRPLLLFAALSIVVLAFALPAAAQEDVTLVPFEDPAYGVEGVLPDGWTKVGAGLYGRGAAADDTVLLAIQGAPLTANALFNAILPQLALTEIPDPIGETETDAFAWTDYRVDVALPTGGTLTVRLALAEHEGNSYLLLLQMPADEAEALEQSVFLPVQEALRPMVTDEEPVPYVVEDVTFESADETLAGTLTMPDGEGPHPAVVLMTGSGPQNREEEVVPGFRIFQQIADHLTRAGIAVLRYDDRGVGESGGDYNAATIQDLAADGLAAVDYLKSRPEIDPQQVGVLGHSEGGIYSAMIGADPDSGVAFIISVAGTATSGLDMLKEQNRAILGAADVPQETIDMQIAYLDKAYPLIVARDWESLETLIYEETLAQWDTLTAEQQAALGGSGEDYAREAAANFVGGYMSEWFPTLLEYNPADDWAQTTVPVLAIFGALDLQVSAVANVEPMEAALEAAGNEDFTIVVLPDANHLMQAAETGTLEEYSTLPYEFTPDFLPTITDWLLERVTVAGE